MRVRMWTTIAAVGALAGCGADREKALDAAECDQAERLPYGEVADDELTDAMSTALGLYTGLAGEHDALITCGSWTRGGPITFADVAIDDVELWLAPDRDPDNPYYECDSLGFGPLVIASMPVLPVGDNNETLGIYGDIEVQTETPAGVLDGVGLLDVSEGPDSVVKGYAWTSHVDPSGPFVETVYLNLDVGLDEGVIRMNLEYKDAADGTVLQCVLRF